MNTAPGAPEVSIDPEEPIEGDDDLICQIDTDSTDVDGDSVSYTFEWEVDGEAYADATTTTEVGDTVPSDDIFEGEIWTCIVTPNDGIDDGDTAEDSVTIDGDPCLGGDTYNDGTDSDGDGLDCASECASSGAYFTVCAGEYLTWEEAEDACLDAGYDGLASVLLSLIHI